jgi:hypothetical protein
VLAIDRSIRFASKARTGARAVKICNRPQVAICWSIQIVRLLVSTAMRMPRSTLAVALFALLAVASTISYTGFLVVGVLAEYLGTGRFVAGLLLGVLFARLPKFSKGKFRTVGLLPKSIRRPVMLSLLAFCLVGFVLHGAYVSAVFVGLTTAFLILFPWMRRAIFGRIVSSIFPRSTEQHRPGTADGTVIDVEFREKKD